VIERINHALAQLVGMLDFTKGDGERFGAFNAGVVRNPTHCEDENIVPQWPELIVKGNRPRREIDPAHCGLNELDAPVQQLLIARSDMPAFNLAAQVLVQHRFEEEMNFVADERHFSRPGEVKRSEEPAEAATDYNDSCLGH